MQFHNRTNTVATACPISRSCALYMFFVIGFTGCCAIP
nr:MAG TPA: hypothetical protein [Caudoviricetes sp.]